MAHRGRHAPTSGIPPVTTAPAAVDEPRRSPHGGDPSTPLSAASHAAHDDITRLVYASQHAEQIAGDPRHTQLASDAAVAAASAHLAVMEVTLYAEIASRLPNGKARVRDLRRQARDVDSVARGIEQTIYGDVHHPTATIARLRDEFAEHLAVHAEAEDALVAELEQQLSDSERERLAKKIETRTRHAPTRPHPRLHFPTRTANRVAMNVAGRWDHLLDTMDNRSAAGTPVKSPAPPGLWGWYLLGRATGEGPPTVEEPSAVEEPRTTDEPPPADRSTRPAANSAAAGDYQSEA